MGLFKAKAKAPNESYETPNPPETKQRKKFILFKNKGGSPSSDKQKDPAASPSNQTAKTLSSQTPSPPHEPGDPCAIDVDGFPVDGDLPEDIPKSISAWAPNGVLSDLGLEEQRGDDEIVRVFSHDDVDSLGSPCEKFRKSMEENKPPGSNPMDPPGGSRKPPGVDIHNPPSVEHLSYYVAALSSQYSPDPSSEPPSRALRSLFSLSEHASSHSDRVAMAHWKPPKEESSSSLIPALLDFLKRCKRDTSEQYLAMLVLNNVSIPHENKRIIALDCGGAKTLARLLCQDPGCHLLVIILVNLTFCEASVRRDMLTYTKVPESENKKKNGACGGDAHLVEALTYALLLASLSNEELASLPPIPLASSDGVPHTPRKLLSILTSNLEIMNLYTSNRYKPDVNAPPLTFEGGFAETARWSLCALKNLTRPDKLAKSSLTNSGAGGSDAKSSGDAVSAYAILDAGLIPLLLRVVRLEIAVQDLLEVGGGVKSPCWTINSPQDAALYTLLHVASVPEVRGVLRDECGLPQELSKIVAWGKSDTAGQIETADNAQLVLQSMKARIALSNLLLSEGYYGQPKSKKPSCDNTSVIIANHEAHYLVELLSNCLQSRPKDGAGGYSASSFSLKGTLHTIRCLMSKRENRLVFASSNSASLNALLLKTIAIYSFREKGNDGGISAIMDAEAAEHAVFSLYLMSNHGFQENFDRSNSERYAFLPAQFEGRGEKEQQDAKNVLTKVIWIYADAWDATPAGRHAALQLLYREKYLLCSGAASDLVYPGKQYPCKSDFRFDEELLAAIRAASIERRMEGVPPSADIFHRGIVRYLTSANRINADPRTFPNALAAVEEISFGSSTTNHSGTIDEIGIANNLVNSADGLTQLAYGFAWRWEDEDAAIRAHPLIDEKIQPLLDDVSETERSAPYSPRRKGIFGRLRFNGGGDDDEPFSVLGFRCGAPMCGK